MKRYFIQAAEETVLFICHIINILTPKNRNQIFFYSMPDFSDNAREIYEELIRHDLEKKYKIVWAVRDVEKYKNILNNVTVVEHRSLKSLFCFCRSHYIFRTHSLWGNKYAEKTQKMFIAWHGMPLKSLFEGDPKPYKCDYINLTSDFFRDHLYSTVAIPQKYNPCIGLARNDLLFRKSNILEDMGFNGYERIYIWMPTFRDSKYSDIKDGLQNEVGIPILNETDLYTLNKILQRENELLILKLHPWSADKMDNISLSNIKNLNDADIVYPHSLYELLGACDTLITDFSSVYIDFLLTGKPIWFVYDDMNEYRKTRGFAFEPAEDYMPGIKINTKEDLIACFEGAYLDNDYRAERERITKLFHQYTDDRSAFRAVKAMGLLQ